MNEEQKPIVETLDDGAMENVTGGVVFLRTPDPSTPSDPNVQGTPRTPAPRPRPIEDP